MTFAPESRAVRGANGSLLVIKQRERTRCRSRLYVLAGFTRSTRTLGTRPSTQITSVETVSPPYLDELLVWRRRASWSSMLSMRTLAAALIVLLAGSANAQQPYARRLDGVQGIAYVAEVAPGLYRGG